MIGEPLRIVRDQNRPLARRHLEAALLWPESLGQGRPFDPDDRLVRFLFDAAAENPDGGPVPRAFETVTIASLRARIDSLAASPIATIEQDLLRRALAAAARLQR